MVKIIEIFKYKIVKNCQKMTKIGKNTKWQFCVQNVKIFVDFLFFKTNFFIFEPFLEVSWFCNFKIVTKNRVFWYVPEMSQIFLKLLSKYGNWTHIKMKNHKNQNSKMSKNRKFHAWHVMKMFYVFWYVIFKILYAKSEKKQSNNECTRFCHFCAKNGHFGHFRDFQIWNSVFRRLKLNARKCAKSAKFVQKCAQKWHFLHLGQAAFLENK